MAKPKTKPPAEPAPPTPTAVETWPIELVIEHPSNARLIPQIAVDKVKASIKEFGFVAPIIINPKGVILAGHTRRRAAYALGLTEVPVRVIDYLTPAQERAYRLADNRTAQETAWDPELLATELADLGPDLASLAGFDPAELDGDQTSGGNSAPGGEGGAKSFDKADGLHVELYMTPAAFARHKPTLTRWGLLKDVEIAWPET